MIGLSHVIDRLQQLEHGISERIAAPSEIRMTNTGDIVIGYESLRHNPEAQKCIARLTGCPVIFFESVPIDPRASIANRLLPLGRMERISVNILNRSEPFGAKPHIRGLALRLPEDYIREELFPPVLEICDGYGIEMVHCKTNLITTK